MDADRHLGTWMIELDSVRAGDCLTLTTEPDGRVRLTTNLRAADAREVLIRGILDLETAAGLPR